MSDCRNCHFYQAEDTLCRLFNRYINIYDTICQNFQTKHGFRFVEQLQAENKALKKQIERIKEMRRAVALRQGKSKLYGLFLTGMITDDEIKETK